MDVFLNRAFAKLSKDGRGKLYAHVRNACDEAREALNRSDDDGFSSRDTADNYILPLVLACRTQKSTLMVTALDCFQKLIAHGYLRGVAKHALDEESAPMDSVGGGSDKGDEGGLGRGGSADR